MSIGLEISSSSLETMEAKTLEIGKELYSPDRRVDVSEKKTEIETKKDSYNPDKRLREREGKNLETDNNREIIDENGYIYKFDNEGRTISAEGYLQPKNHEDRYRIKASLEEIGGGDQREGDERGHVIADQHEGRPEKYNLVAMSHDANAAFSRVENTCANAVKEGKDVKYRVDVKYEGESKRPSEFEITYTIDGEEKHVVISNGGDAR